MSAGDTLLFLFLGVLNVGLGLWLCGYAAYWFLLVTDLTACGTNVVKVHWPHEPFLDRLWKLGHLGFLVFVWLLPVFACLHYVELPLPSGSLPPLISLTAGVVLWLMLPLSLLSSMTGPSHWEILRWAVLWRLVQRWRTWLAFYAYTCPLLIGCVLVAYLALYGWQEVMEAAEATSLTWLPPLVNAWSWGFVLPLTATMAATALLIYARLVGRLAWLMDFWDEEGEEEETEREPEPPTADLAASHDALEPATPMSGEEVIPFAAESATVAPPVRVAPARPPLHAKEPETKPVERRLWVRGIYRFPWYRGSLLAWCVLSLGGLLLAALIRIQIMQLHD